MRRAVVTGRAVALAHRPKGQTFTRSGTCPQERGVVLTAAVPRRSGSALRTGRSPPSRRPRAASRWRFSAAGSHRRCGRRSRPSHCWCASCAPRSMRTNLSEAQRNARLKRINADRHRARPHGRPRQLAAGAAHRRRGARSTKPARCCASCGRSTRAAGRRRARAESDAGGAVGPAAERRVVPQSVISRQLANPFLAPDFSEPPPPRPQTRRLSSWELLGPLLRVLRDGLGWSVRPA